MTDQEKVIDEFDTKINRFKKISRKEELSYIRNSKFKTDYYFMMLIPNGLRNKKILDIGSFFPFDAIYWASIVEEFHLLDISQKVLDYGKEVIESELAEDLVQKVKFQRANAAKLPYKDNFFDVVTAFSSLDHIPEKENRNKAFSEIARVTKRRGFVIVTVPNRLNFKYYRNHQKHKTGVIFWTPNELKKFLIRNKLKPLIFTSSAGDKTVNNIFISRIYNRIVQKFGKRMGWLAQKY